MLELRPDCERCGIDLAPDLAGAHVCSFECTFCTACTTGVLAGRCPNCGGDLQPRPVRSKTGLVRFPASTERKYGR